MTQHEGPLSPRGTGHAVWIGPGEKLAPLRLVLTGLGGPTERVEDLAELSAARAGADVEVVLDADTVPIEDLGYVRRFLNESAHTHVALVGTDAGTRVVRTILAWPRTRWMPWPPLLDDLITLAGVQVKNEPKASAPRAMPAVRAPEPSPVPSKRVTPFAPREDDDVAAVSALLARDEQTSTSPRSETASSPRPHASDEAIVDEADFEPLLAPSTRESPFEPTAGAEHTSAGDAPPPWWRAQIADLADTAQRVELGLQALRMVEPDSHEEVREQVDRLDGEVARLVQFARTLGYVASPPSRGDQVFDLADTVQVFVAQLASRPEATPRCQFRSNEPVYVRSDRALLGQAFDAFFWLAGACSAKNDLVRAQVIRDGGPAEVRLEFPSGPLEHVETARILEPYGLRRILPDLGPNALSAATSIVVGQGGSVELVRPQKNRLAWRVVLPAVEAPATKKKSK